MTNGGISYESALNMTIFEKNIVFAEIDKMHDEMKGK